MKRPVSVTGHTTRKGPAPQQSRNGTTDKKRGEEGQKAETERVFGYLGVYQLQLKNRAAKYKRVQRHRRQ